MRSQSQTNIMKMGDSDKNKLFLFSKARSIINISSDLYPSFNEFQLIQSRLSTIPEYKRLVKEVTDFNQQLGKWRNDQQAFKIKNFKLTYHFYQNLTTRIRCVNNFTLNFQQARKAIVQTTQWFMTQKPRIRGAPQKKPQPLMKPFQQNRSETVQQADMGEYIKRKRQMTPYEMMSRTTHTSFFPPKQRLLDYHKKQFIMNRKLTIDGNFALQQRQRGNQITPFSANKVQQNKTSSKRSLLMRTTMTTLGNTAQSFGHGTRKGSSTARQIKQQKITNDIQIDQFDPQGTLKDEKQAQTKKNLQQQQMVKSVLDDPKFQEDEAEEQDILEDQRQNDKYNKVYEYEHKQTASAIVQTQQSIKDHKQSTLRRLLKTKQLEVQNKLQDINVKQKMTTWARTRSFINGQIVRKSQSYRHVNNFAKTAYQKKGFFENRKKKIPQYQFATYRNKTIEDEEKKNTVQEQVEKRKINEAMRMFGKYIIPHVNVGSPDPENQQNPQFRLMRAKSLTAFNRVNLKKKQFGQFLTAHNVDVYNNQMANSIIELKSKLSTKRVTINKKKTFSALCAASNHDKLNGVQVFPKTITLLSNPFFPKHLYQSKKKKK